ncbi:MAG TPA: DUF389 domain-containing protein [Thermoleophilaceae bacterium]
MLQIRVFGTTAAMTEVGERLSALPSLRHVTRSPNGDSNTSVVSADLSDGAGDVVLQTVRTLGVPPEDIVLLRVDSIGPSGMSDHPISSVVWTDLVSQAGANARPLARYLVFMAVAGVIAGFGVIYANGILVVGAMAVSPDMLPITATCTGLVLHRWRLSARAFVTLTAGLAVGCIMAGVVAALMDLFNALPDGFNIGETGLQGLSSVNASTVFVAFAAGIAGILAFETRASAAVGVAISVTTIPASAYLGVAAGVGEVDKALGALLVLGINVSMLVLAGSSTLLLQRRLGRGAAAGTDDAHP